MMMKKKTPLQIAENWVEEMFTAEAAVFVPCSITADKKLNIATSNGSKWPSQAIKTPVKPFPPTKVALKERFTPHTKKKAMTPERTPQRESFACGRRS